MNILVSFIPFIVFALFDRLVGPFEGLLLATAVSIALVVRERIAGRTPKILEVGSVILFGALTLYVFFAGDNLPLMAVRLLVDSGLLAIVLVSIAIGTPFTIQYAREKVPEQYWQSPRFRKTNLVITWVWALAFAITVAADAVLLFAPQVPPQFGTIVIILSLVAAFKFTVWYPKQQAGPAQGK